MKTIYIAGPYRAATPWAVEQNIRAAEAYILPLAEKGYAVLCPHTMTRGFDGTMTDEYWLAATLELMRRCDAVFVVPGSWDSEGALGEMREACRLGLPVYFTLEDVPEA